LLYSYYNLQLAAVGRFALRLKGDWKLYVEDVLERVRQEG